MLFDTSWSQQVPKFLAMNMKKTMDGCICFCINLHWIISKKCSYMWANKGGIRAFIYRKAHNNRFPSGEIYGRCWGLYSFLRNPTNIPPPLTKQNKKSSKRRYIQYCGRVCVKMILLSTNAEADNITITCSPDADDSPGMTKMKMIYQSHDGKS